jgi:hypothetical protein
MSLIVSCNYCGEPIVRGDPYVTLNGNGDRSAAIRTSGYVGHWHYHADPQIGCWKRILAVIRAAEDWPSKLDRIPTANHQPIAARRRKHRHIE